jgi:excisionase family DNA binding protein
MSDKKLPKFLTMKDFRENIINWSDDTIRRRIKDEALPAVQEGNGRYLFPTQDVLEWFKRRTAKPA